MTGGVFIGASSSSMNVQLRIAGKKAGPWRHRRFLEQSANAGLTEVGQQRPDAGASRRLPCIGLVAASLDILGGQGVQARQLQEGLTADGYRVRFIPVNPAFPRWMRSLRRIPVLRTFFNQLLYLPSLVQLRNVDVAHVFSASYWSFLLAPTPAMLIARLFRKHVVLHYHSGEARDHLSRWGWLVHPWLRLADEIVVPSEYLQRAFGDFGYRTRVVSNVVNLGHFHFRKRSRLQPHFLSMRNLEAHYGVDTIIRAFALIKAECSDATLVVAGYGSEMERLHSLARDLVPDGIRFAGRVEPSDVPALYDAADIFLNAAVVDNQPVSVIEAFASGIPVITTGTGDIANMVCGGKAGVIVPPADPGAMADAALMLLSHPDRAVQMADQARSAVTRYTWPQVAEQWTAIYQGANG